MRFSKYAIIVFILLASFSCKKTSLTITEPGPDFFLNKIASGNWQGVTVDGDKLTIDGKDYTAVLETSGYIKMEYGIPDRNHLYRCLRLAAIYGPEERKDFEEANKSFELAEDESIGKKGENIDLDLSNMILDFAYGDSIFKDTHIHMIPVSPNMSHLFEINSAISRGEVVSIPADRFCGSTKKIDKCFLGKNAPLPYGPFSIATMHALDVVAVNVMKTSTKQYTIYITPLLYNKEASRKAQIEELADAYIKELERMLRLFPAQWYNYFDFWNKDE